MSDRKARLAALAAKAGRTKEAPSGEQDHSSTAAPTVNFRNYTPADSLLEQGVSEEPPSKRSKTEEKSVLEKALEEAKAEVPTLGAAEQDVVAIAPKKINWDLKRDIQPKLDKLQKRTQRAIVELLRERLEKEVDAADID